VHYWNEADDLARHADQGAAAQARNSKAA
jgi:hypothetical protein